jgi:hypothetical protein
MVSPRARSFVRVLALLGPVAGGCATRESSSDPAVRPANESGSQQRASAPDASLATTREALVGRPPVVEPAPAACPPSPPAGPSPCATEERCAYDAMGNALTTRAPGHGDTQCECAPSGRWECQQLIFAGPLAPPELALA